MRCEVFDGRTTAARATCSLLYVCCDSIDLQRRRGGQDCSKAYRFVVGRCSKFPRSDPPGRTRFRADDGTRHSSFRRKGHVRVALRLLSESISRSIPRLPCRNASVSASTSMAFGGIDGSSGTRDRNRKKVMPSEVSEWSRSKDTFSRLHARRPRSGSRTERPEAFTTI